MNKLHLTRLPQMTDGNDGTGRTMQDTADRAKKRTHTKTNNTCVYRRRQQHGHVCARIPYSLRKAIKQAGFAVNPILATKLLQTSTRLSVVLAQCTMHDEMMCELHAFVCSLPCPFTMHGASFCLFAIRVSVSSCETPDGWTVWFVCDGSIARQHVRLQWPWLAESRGKAWLWRASRRRMSLRVG